MTKSAKIIAATAFCIAWPATFALAQTVQLPHGNAPPVPVGSGNVPAARAGSLLDRPQSPAEIAAGVPKMTFVSPAGNVAHMMPTVQVHAAIRAAAGVAALPAAGTAATGLDNPGGPMTYHSGGPIMGPNGVQAFAIFWDGGGTLQNGTSTGFSVNYGQPTLIATAWLQSHGLMNVGTQYYQQINGATTYFQNMGGLQAFVVDHGAYPASGCTDTATPGNCVTDQQMINKIAAVVSAQGWQGGLGNIYVLFTSSGEGSCFNNTNASCAYIQYCAYHSSFTFNSQTYIYAIIPYGNPNGCQAGGQTTPNDPAGDLAANVTTHEIMEAATDPFGNAWFGSMGTSSEIGDLCNFIFGPQQWIIPPPGANIAGNQAWNGVVMEVQEMYDNHAQAQTGTGCVQVGPQ
jgi:hypothetical protein